MNTQAQDSTPERGGLSLNSLAALVAEFRRATPPFEIWVTDDAPEAVLLSMPASSPIDGFLYSLSGAPRIVLVRQETIEGLRRDGVDFAGVPVFYNADYAAKLRQNVLGKIYDETFLYYSD